MKYLSFLLLLLVGCSNKFNPGDCVLMTHNPAHPNVGKVIGYSENFVLVDTDTSLWLCHEDALVKMPIAYCGETK